MSGLAPDALEYYALHRDANPHGEEPYNLEGLFVKIQEYENTIQLFKTFPPITLNQSQSDLRKPLVVNYNLNIAIRSEIFGEEKYLMEQLDSLKREEKFEWILRRLTERTLKVFKILYREEADHKININIKEPLPRTMWYGPIGHTIRLYQDFREIFEPYMLKQWKNVPKDANTLIEEAWDKFVASKIKLRHEVHGTLSHILVPTYVIPFYTQKISEQYLLTFSNVPSIAEGIKKLKDAEAFIKRPLLFWEKIHESIIFLAHPTLPEIQTAPEILTPAKSQTFHAELWGYDSADTAFKKGRPLKKIWDNVQPSQRIKALPCSEILPYIQEFRKKNKWRSPISSDDILDMYRNPDNWK